MAEGPIAVGPYVMATTKSLGLTLARRCPRTTRSWWGRDVLLEKISSLLAEEPSPRTRAAMCSMTRDRIIVHSDKAMMDLLLENLSAGTAGNRPGPTFRIQCSMQSANCSAPRTAEPEAPSVFWSASSPISQRFRLLDFPGSSGQHGCHRRTASDFTEASVRPS